MQVINAKNAKDCERQVIQAFATGKLVAYPTDTVYGLGCDATNETAVERVYWAKQREKKPVSVIAPSIQWIKENCECPNDNPEKYLPGPYTLVLPLKNKDCVSEAVLQGRETLGVRIPRHWISSVAKDFGKPVVTTSLNLSGKPTITCLEELPESIEKHIDLFVSEGRLEGRPSTIVLFSEGKTTEVRR
ncbi:MAG TPA: L-threonylcarbamoyladenylate synthase [archaeon]|nr:L-threonylcarbamoyladenylate synthase [archaeon]HLD81140.1 L-threonylcarbamoyladenylate synthase [archaeon]